ncbi:MAG: Mu-like prophage major head subunit gpT family protein [Alphaproteobacteria bacterium]|nr:Mu-like prophage major head subunit gpT family protein [Alphaproteobacteria bacterium]
MLVNSANFATLFAGFKASFNKGFESAASYYKDVAMVVPSLTASEQYGWMKQISGMREWLGPRVVNNISLAGYTITNRKFENTIGLARTDVEDDQYGVLSPLLSEMGKAAAEFPDTLVFSLLRAGMTTDCYDGQFFFDTDHPVVVEGIETTVSNLQTGAGDAWFLLDTSRMMKPLIFQNRMAPEFQQLTDTNDDTVFKNDEFLYGVRSRCNVGFGLWQLAFGSRAALTPANYKAARAAMMGFRGDGGRPLGVIPNTLVVPPSLESDALKIINSEYGDGGVTNEWKGTARLIVTPWVIPW